MGTEPPIASEPERFLPLPARDFYILFFLAERERHGYGLVKSIAEHTNGLVELDPANLYRAIQRLAADGLVEDGPRRQTEGGRERRYYRITDLGREVVAAEVERMRELAALAARRELAADPERRR